MKQNIWALSVALIGALSLPAFSQEQQGVIVRCGASKGSAYFFKDELFNPDGPKWLEDGMRNGRISLVKLGDEWDIQFGDALGTYGYRQDGATVIPLGASEKMMTIGAFGGAYVAVYTFDLVEREVLWSSHKIGTGLPKVGLYRADCN